MKSTDWHEYEVGDIIVSLKQRQPYREVGSMFKIISLDNVMYYKPQTNSHSPEEWRPATEREIELFNSGATNINQIPQEPSYEIY